MKYTAEFILALYNMIEAVVFSSAVRDLYRQYLAHSDM
jgi:hypothetical protein